VLGTYGTSAFNSLDDFSNHRDYLSFLYADLEGFIARCTISPSHDENGKPEFHQTLWKNERLINYNRYFNVLDVYTSMNSFWKGERKVSELKHLNALFIDIDCYKIGKTQEQVILELETEYFGEKLPVPTFLINSGRGLYLIWKIDEDRNALPRWKSVQQYLYETCLPFGADSQALDAARILRVPYSINSKNGETVSILSYSNVQYTLYEIIHEFDIEPVSIKDKPKNEVHKFGEATEKQRKFAKDISEKTGLPLPDFNSFDKTFDFIKDNLTHGEFKSDEKKNNILLFPPISIENTAEIKSLLEGRCNDLRLLFSMRKGVDCCREYGLFLYRLWLCQITKDFDYALIKTLEFNSSLDCPFTENYVISHTKSAEEIIKKGSTYKYKTETLIEVLKITQAEMKYLHYICDSPISQKEKKSKKNHRNYKNRLNRQGKLEKKEQINERRQTIINMRNEKKTKEEICDFLNISFRTYERDLVAIFANGVLNVVKNTVETIVDNISDTLETISNKVNGLINDTIDTLKSSEFNLHNNDNENEKIVNDNLTDSMNLVSKENEIIINKSSNNVENGEELSDSTDLVIATKNQPLYCKKNASSALLSENTG